MNIREYTIGTGDRFAHEGEAQLQAVLNAREAGIDVYPTWNKSYREHGIVKTQPQDVRKEADAAVRALGWDREYYVDADHIALKTVDSFLQGADFFTLDVADFVGKAAEADAIEALLADLEKYRGSLQIPGVAAAFEVNESTVRETAGKFLRAIQEAGAIYRYIEEKKGADNFVTEVSVDETDSPQTPVELFLILAMIARESIPVRTIAPKFTGRFNKGVDYVGDLQQFEKEFDEDLAVIAFAVREFGLPAELKLSVHSGSDKFSIYPIMNRLIKKHGAGLHLKTAGTTWLEEVIGLADAGGDGLEVAKEIYAQAHGRFEELTAPYATVIDIDEDRLPGPDEVSRWSSKEFVEALRHEQQCSAYNPHLRQLIHVGFKVAAEMGDRFTDALRDNRQAVAANVTYNLEHRHIRPLFG